MLLEEYDLQLRNEGLLPMMMAPQESVASSSSQANVAAAAAAGDGALVTRSLSSIFLKVRRQGFIMEVEGRCTCLVCKSLRWASRCTVSGLLALYY